ncbi:hypothetical protein DOTSEDRAFT_60657 [Dothistroma septosporum NZE10]|uniref:FRG1-like family protein n=1 Tax=Dothistroma septosporum (strain NZE10 / CBS 128990) TaxID=675120 RepID=N1PSL2_DOTSN|nr:hypothetical protein DOTSEDRAFT_60657 [Dothistroma septosporum NZE10]
MVKPLTFKGDNPAKKRKRTHDDDAATDAPSSKALVTDTVEDDENWVSADTIDDISGPVMLVLSGDKAACMAVDQFGKVFTSGVENMVENEPSTAEPHDVRQVWVSQRIVGTQDGFTLKGHHGRYLGCDQYGFLSAAREAVSPEETFKITASSNAGLFNISNTRSDKTRFVTVDNDKSPAEIRGDAEDADETTAVRVRMQARFKPRHKVEKAEKVRAKISRKELEDGVGRRLDDEEVKKLKKARREGNYHEVMLDVKVKGKHDKFA